MLIICTTFAAGGSSEGLPPPSLLVACPSTPFFFPGGWVSMQWMRDLVKDGVQVDYTTSLGDLNRTRLFGCVHANVPALLHDSLPQPPSLGVPLPL